MNAQQITFPFRTKKSRGLNVPNADLIGRAYREGQARVVVTSVCLNDQSRVMVERDLDGRTWSMPAWLMRLIFLETKGKRAA